MRALTVALVWTGLALAAAGAEAPMPGLADIQAWAGLDGGVHVRWTSAEPSQGAVHWGRTPAALDQSVDEDASCLRGTTNHRDSGQGFANNHRADFAGPGEWPLFCRVVAAARSGARLESAVMEVPAPRLPEGSARQESLRLAVDAGDWPLAAMPVTFGVPFPRGCLARAEAVRVVVEGRAVPTQTQIVARWFPDLSVKWLRVDSVVPRDARELVLEYGREVAAPAAGTASPDPAAGLPREDLLTLTAADGTAYRFSPATRVLEESGAVKVVTRFAGPYVADGRTLFRGVLRVYRWQGVPAVRWDITLENDHVEQEMTAFRAFEMRLDGSPGQVTVGEGAERVALAPGERVLQREDAEWVHEPSGARGKRLDGVVGTGDGAVVLRHLWEQWPAAVGLEPGGLVLGLCPRLPEGFYAGRPDEDRLYYALRDGLHTVRQGWSKTWEGWTLPGQGPAAGALAGLAGGRMPVVSLPPQWVEDSGALGRLAVAVRAEFPGYDEALAANIEGFAAERDRGREYGMMNFGDWHGERQWNWGNLEYDLGHAFLTQFARSGNPAFRRHADAIVRHQRDVDTRHAAKDPRRVGQQWIHSIGHTAGYYDDHYKEMKVYAGTGWSDNRGHIWAQGMLEHYLLGGDRRSWETGLLIADWAAGPQTTNFTFGLAREPGWMLKLVLSAYAATEDPFYLNAARIMAAECHRQSLASGDHGFFYHALSRGHCDCPEGARHSGEAGFMLATLMTGLALYADVTGDPVAAADIAKTARFVVDTMWVPTEQGFRYTSCPQTQPSAGSAWILLHGLSFGARHSGDAALAAVCRQALAAAWTTLPRSGKSAGYVLCNSAQALAAVAELPGPGFGESLRDVAAALAHPARRSLPTLVPNPDFEDGVQGWPSRGWTVTASTEVRHGGRASLRVSGRLQGQNEFVNTTYDAAAGSPWEITGLRPDSTYRLSAWLRIDRISPGVPAPSLRLALRDASGTRGGVATPAYDLSRPGTWQCLAVDVAIPAWNTRNYIALNTNTREAVDVDLYLDDVHLTAAGALLPEGPRLWRLDPGAAVLSGGATVQACTLFRDEAALCGPGAAEWALPPEAAGAYRLWARLDRGARLERVTLGGRLVATACNAAAGGWLDLGPVAVSAEGARLRVEGLAAGTRVGRLLLTDVPGASLLAVLRLGE